MKKLHFHTRVSTAKFYKGIRVFGNFPQTVGMLGLVENCETMQKMHLVVCGNPCMKMFCVSRPIYVNVDSLYVNVDSLSHH